MNLLSSAKRAFSSCYLIVWILFFVHIGVVSAGAQTIFDRTWDIWLGVSVTNQTISVTSDAAAFNDQLDYKIGAGLHLHANWYFDRRFALRTGLSYQYFDWEFNDLEMQVTDPTGAPTGAIQLRSLSRGFHIMYAGVPLHLRFHPYATHFYLTAGADFWYKFRHKVGLVDTFLIDPEGEVFELLSSERYNTPGFAEDFLVAGIAGLGFKFTLDAIHLGIEFNARRNLTPFYDRQGLTQNFTQYGVSFSVRL